MKGKVKVRDNTDFVKRQRSLKRRALVAQSKLIPVVLRAEFD